VNRWHRPGMLAADRAREVARTCWEALAAPDPDCTCHHPALAEAIGKAATLAGEGWLVPQLARHGPDDWVTVTVAAELVGRSVEWVYRWVAKDRANRAIVGSDGLITVRVGSVQDAVAESRRP
jgi:hypothetical protein